MINLSNYWITKQIYESKNSLVYRGVCQQNNQPVILKLLREDYPTPEELTRYQQEYEITHQVDIDGVVSSISLESYGNSKVIVFDDFGGDSLKIYMSQHQLTLREFLEIAIKITTCLEAIHNHNIIHKDINPSNIIYNSQTKEIKIIDFGISTVLSRENPIFQGIDILEGTLPYISPEQTGRMNRVLDYRTDFYSLGVTFYELLTNQLPFTENNPLDLVHSHIAKQPVAPHLINLAIPEAISHIVMKLMGKIAEERYQSSGGIKFDLEFALQQLITEGNIENFDLARGDISDKFQIPQKLYGREKEIEILINTFERVSLKGSELILVSGYSGIGKSSLVKEVYQSVTKAKGYFIKGKFEQYQRNIPYWGIIQGFRELIQQLLTESEIRLVRWREEILLAVGKNAGVIIDVIPELEFIIGVREEVPNLSLREAKNRFNLVFERFISVFTKPEHPLVIFLDDLQWCDSASLKLIESLLAGNSNCLLLIGAYRDNEVDSIHPLKLTLDRINNLNINVNYIQLSPLKLSDVNQIITETLKSSLDITSNLAKLVKNKTDGNPFFIKEFLISLYRNNLLTFNYQLKSWEWDTVEIQKQNITDNVVSLMTEKIKLLPKSTQKLIKIAACIGNQFELERLALFSEDSLKITALNLHPAIEIGLILPLSEAYKSIELGVKPPREEVILYKFVHDRIQQGAYNLISEDFRQKIHLRLGQSLLQNISENQLEGIIFEIVNSFNQSINIIKSQIKLDELAKLNLIAARKAKLSGAYEPAFKYLHTGIQLLAENSWENQYQLTLSLYTEAVEAAFANTNLSEVLRLSEIVFKQARNILDKIPVYQILVQFYIGQNQMQTALDTGLEVLEILDIPLVKTPPQNLIITELENQSPVESPEIKAALGILISLIGPVYQTFPVVWEQVVFTMVTLCKDFGNSPESAIAFLWYGILLCGSLENIDLGYQFGELGLRILEKFENRNIQAKFNNAFYGGVFPWKRDIKAALKPLQENINFALEAGEIEYGSYSTLNYSWLSLAAGKPLESLNYELRDIIELNQKLQQDFQVITNQLCRQFILNLLGSNSEVTQLKGEAFNEDEIIPRMMNSQNIHFMVYYYIPKTMICYLFKDYSVAYTIIQETAKHQDSGKGLHLWIQHNFYQSLTYLSLYKTVSEFHQQELLEQVEKNQIVMKKWAENAPMNFQHKYDLVEAEKARYLEQPLIAMDFYDKAIAGAKQYEYIQEEALANELATYFYLSRGQKKIAQVYLTEARYCYLKWGAKAKIIALEREYPELLTQQPKKYEIQNNNLTTTANFSTDKLDLATLINVSKAISQETDINQLLNILVQFLLSNTGAQRGCIIGAQLCELTNQCNEYTAKNNFQFLEYETAVKSNNLPVSVINYVKRSRKNIILHNAAVEGLFCQDEYIKINQTKSILCIPLLSQGRAIGILYLENNLATNVFNDERLEIVKIISAQGAIAIENAILKNKEENSVYEYQVGGCLTPESPTYVIRKADSELYHYLKSGEFCYVLNARHMGKSSLRVQIMKRLQSEGIACAAIDLTAIGSQNITVEQWYAGLIYSLVNYFNLAKKSSDQFNFRQWWRNLDFLSPVQRFDEFISQVLLKEVSQKIVIFIDEIDTTLSLNFPMDDFFAVIRAFYNHRGNNPEYKRLSFVLLGVASPSNLIQDKNLTPFNLGKGITLEGFQLYDIEPLAQGLTPKYSNSQTILKAILTWTNGQPFLTQKICYLISRSPNLILEGKEAEFVDKIIKNQIIENWDSQDNPEHLTTIRNRLLKSQLNVNRLLEIYRQILIQGEILANDSPEQIELLLTGLIYKQQDKLKIYNPIYREIFNLDWIEKLIDLQFHT